MKKLVLDDENFRIIGGFKPIEGNKEWLVNATNDVWANDKTGEQLFTWEAAVREVSKLKDGRRLPTIDELCSFSDEEIKKPFNDLLAGYRGTGGSFYGRGSSANDWSSSESGGSAWLRLLYSGNPTVCRYTYSKAYGFSVRLVREVVEEEIKQKKCDMCDCYARDKSDFCSDECAIFAGKNRRANEEFLNKRKETDLIAYQKGYAQATKDLLQFFVLNQQKK